MKRICILTTSNLPYDTRILNEAETLSSIFEVTVLAKKHQKSPKTKYPFVVKYSDYPRKGPFFLQIISSFYQLTKEAFKENPDFFHAHDLDGLLCSYLPALLKKKRLIYDSHELWTGLYPYKNLSGLQWLLGPLERLLMTKVKVGITVNRSLSKMLEKKYHKKFLTLYNFPKSQPLLSTEKSLKKKFPTKKIILQLGAIDEGRGLEQIIESSKLLPENFLVVLLGQGLLENQIRGRIVELGLSKKAIMLPAVPPKEIMATIKSIDLGLALIQKQSLSYYYSLPNKLFQYLMAEVPILGSNFPEYKAIILKNKIGEVVDPSKPAEIAQKIKEMLKPLKQKIYRQNLRGLAEKKYNWQLEAEKLQDFYRELLK